MSKWYAAQKDFIEIDGDNIDIYVCNDYDGSIYIQVPMKILKEVLQEKNKTINDLLKELNK
jgi:hypothetical protein